MSDFTNGAHECFCDRKYKDANKLASCGDCPRDYIAGAWDARRKYIEEHSKMTDRYKSRASTHADDCWGWGPKHYECAVGQVERDEDLLRQALEALEVSTRFVYADLRPQCEDAIAALRERLGETK